MSTLRREAEFGLGFVVMERYKGLLYRELDEDLDKLSLDVPVVDFYQVELLSKSISDTAIANEFDLISSQTIRDTICNAALI